MRRSRRKPANAPRAKAEGKFAAVPPEQGEVIGLAEDIASHMDTSPVLTGGDLDADWHGAAATGEEAVGGSVPTPDQDVVDELGHALGVPREDDAEVVTSDEILTARDRRRWDLEAEAAAEDE